MRFKIVENILGGMKRKYWEESFHHGGVLIGDFLFTNRRIRKFGVQIFFVLKSLLDYFRNSIFNRAILWDIEDFILNLNFIVFEMLNISARSDGNSDDISYSNN